MIEINAFTNLKHIFYIYTPKKLRTKSLKYKKSSGKCKA